MGRAHFGIGDPYPSSLRHVSFLAALGALYTNLKDALAILQHHATLHEAPLVVDFATPQFNASADPRDLLWNIDTFDLSHRSKDASTRNLSSYFHDGLVPPTDENMEAALAALLFSNPDHPHHLKGMTPFEFGLAAPTAELNAQPLPSPGIELNVDDVRKRKRTSTGTNVSASQNSNGNINSNGNLNANGNLNSNANGNGNLNSNHVNPPQFKDSFKERDPKENDAFKRIKMEKNPSFTSLPLLLNSNDDEWLREILLTPYDANLPAPSHAVGFNKPTQPQMLPAEISLLFRARQVDLVKHLNPSMTNMMDFEFGFDSVDLDGGNYNFIGEALRARIVRTSNLADDKLPSCADLNNYMRLYELEFNKYFPFIHLPSLKSPVQDNLENIPLLLLMALIGALYLYHDSNTVLLFNLSKFHIQNFFEKEITLDNLQFKKVPLMALQCLVLHIFILMFLNEPNMIDVTSRQIKLMVGLIKLTNFNEPLENFLNPPESCLHNPSPNVIQLNFDYFILAQLRIRALHVFYMLQSFRSALIDVPVLFDLSSLRSGNHCRDERLWKSDLSTEWYSHVQKSEWYLRERAQSVQQKSSENSSRFIVHLSNGEPFAQLTHVLETSAAHEPVSFNNSLALLMYIHEQIQLDKPKPFCNVTWQLQRRPRLIKLVKAWEGLFCKSGGTLHIDSSNKLLLVEHNEFKVILPLYLFVKIKLVINLNPVVAPVLYKNWPQMNAELGALMRDEPQLELLKQCVPHCLELIQLWTYNMESMRDDLKEISLRSPVFFVTCLFVSVILLSAYLTTLEDKPELTTQEAVLWLRCGSVLVDVETLLDRMLQLLYLETLTKDSAFVKVGVKDSFHKVKLLVQGFAPPKDVSTEVRTAEFALKSLYLGVRILADAPVWPIAMGFAEGLKYRGMFLSERKEKR